MAAVSGCPRPRPRRPERLPGLGELLEPFAPRRGLLRGPRAPPACPGVACLATRPCRGRPSACPALSLSCQVPAASGLRPVPPLPASPGLFHGVLPGCWAPGWQSWPGVCAWGEGATGATTPWEAPRGNPVKGKGTKPNQGGLRWALVLLGSVS